MYCHACGAQRLANARFCTSCGAALAPEPSAQAYDATKERVGVLPVNTSIWAIVAGYAGLVSPVLLFTAPVAFVCGVIGLRDLRRRPGTRGHVRCWVGIVIGGLITLLAVTALIIALTTRP